MQPVPQTPLRDLQIPSELRDRILPLTVLVDLARQLDRAATELGRMRGRHDGLLPEAYHLSAGVRRSGGWSNPVLRRAPRTPLDTKRPRFSARCIRQG